MKGNQQKINELLYKIDMLQHRQTVFSKEINDLRNELYALRVSEEKEETTLIKEQPLVSNESLIPNQEKTVEKVILSKSEPYSASKEIKPKEKSDLEKFIGENLLNKIGIAITVIGVAIGAKYSFENDLISPLTRIILGYLMGIGLFGFGMKLKKKYKSYSAVLISGAIAIMYFVTFSAYSFYNLIPQTLTFALMVVFTTFTVIAAIHYNKQVIAHIGLVGAYAVPFLLSDGSGKVGVLFSYMTIINIGILVIAFKKYWKSLYYSAFVLTWLIYFSWYLLNFDSSIHFSIAITFLILFFAVFYLTFLAYKLIKKEKFEKTDIILLLVNSFIFYSLGYNLLSSHDVGEQFLGIFTLCNAIIHFIVSAVIYKMKLADKNLFYLISGLVLVFITIAIPVQLDGNWVTLLWVGQAALLFWIGRTKNVPIYEKLSYPLMLIAFLSIVHDWSIVYGNYYSPNQDTRLKFLFNINFLSSVIFVIAFGFINFLYVKKQYISGLNEYNRYSKFISLAIPTVLILTLYLAFRLEIVAYWDQLYADTAIKITNDNNIYETYNYDYDLRSFKRLWIINYSLLFLSILSFINIKKIKNEQLGFFNLILNVIVIFVFLSQGLYEISELRERYLDSSLKAYFESGSFNIAIRYLSFIFLGILLYMCYLYARQDFIKHNLKVVFSALLHVTILWVISSELLHWMDFAEVTESYKLGLSILWGVYSLFLIGIGIWKQNKPIRIGAIILFGVTLIKLFFYDISHLNTISKTIVFVSLGVLLLIISFLYNKYKNIISNEGGDS